MTADSTIPTRPADDGAIDQALAGIDAALADWAAAMTAAESALNVVNESPAPGPTGSRIPEEIAPDLRFADPTVMFAAEPLPDGEPAEAPQAAAIPFDDAERTKAVKPFVAPNAGRETRSTVTDDADHPQVDEMLSEEDADAILMAALDPATAYALRMKRRMTERKLSTTELMDGLWDRASHAEAKKSKKWWKRRKSEQ